MSKARDIADILSASTAIATDAEVTAAINAHNTSANGHVKRGNTASRPASPAAGDVYANTQTGFMEVYSGATYGWEQIGGIASQVTSVTATDTPTSRAFNNGAAAITFTPGTILGRTYTVTSSPGSYTASGTASPITITGLQSSTQYTYTVVASNNYGTASASSASSAVTATTVPQAPSISAVGASQSATITITAGATGGSAITGYSIISNPVTTTQTTSNTTYTFTGLTDNTSYTFTATATNTNGTSVASSVSNSITPATLVTNGLVFNLDASTYSGSGAWNDLSGNSRNATVTNATFVSAGAGSYFSLNGTNQYIDCTLTGIGTATFTTEHWFYLNDFTDGFLTATSYQGSDPEIRIGTQSAYSGKIYHTWYDDNAYLTPTGAGATTNATISTGTWFNLVTTTNGNTLKVYINGSLDKTITLSPAYTGRTGGGNLTDHTVGTYNAPATGYGGYINGRLGAYRWYNRDLSSSEITQNFNSIRGRYGL